MKCRSAPLITAARRCLHARRILVPIRQPTHQSIYPPTQPFSLKPPQPHARVKQAWNVSAVTVRPPVSHGCCKLRTHRNDPASRKRAGSEWDDTTQQPSFNRVSKPADLGPRAHSPTRWRVWQAWGWWQPRLRDNISEAGAHWHWGRGASLDSMRRPRLSTLSSTMTPRLHENPLAALPCDALQYASQHLLWRRRPCLVLFSPPLLACGRLLHPIMHVTWLWEVRHRDYCTAPV